MKDISELTVEDARLLKEIIAYKKVDAHQVSVIQNFGITYIDKSIRICPTCPSQIRFAHKRVVDWHNRFEEQINFKLQISERIERTEEKSDNICLGCQKELLDKRKSYCSKKCKDEFKKK